LLEIIEKFKLGPLFHNAVVADLGAAPGSWSQVSSQLSGANTVLALDTQVVQPIPGVTIKQVDLFEHNLVHKVVSEFLLQNNKQYFNAVVSDMAPSASGNSSDAIKSFALLQLGLEYAIKYLQPNIPSQTQDSVFIGKLIQGESIDDLKSIAQAHFQSHRFFKPKSSRSESKEIFLICTNRLG
jgi:23S rRNA (uridine2552-2'-O)-methyltransferase